MIESYEQERERQRDAAASRVEERTECRHEHAAALAGPGGLAAADTPERVAKRVDRLARYYGDPAVANGAGPEKLLEKIILTADFVGARYLDAGVAAARAVGRVRIRDGIGRDVGFGTGSLVSPALLLTNHHVLPDAETARASVIEFNFQDGVDGRPLDVTLLPLDPDRFFLADDERDFALVAVRATAAELAPFGFNPLIEAEGKAIIGEYVTIVQHPRGEKKQVALRENKIVDIPDRFLHYAADTEPGSSGSPVFNDQWEVVRAAPRERAGARPPGARRVHERGDPGQPYPEVRARAAARSAAARPGRPADRAGRARGDAARAGGPARPLPRRWRRRPEVTVTVPLEITVRVGGGEPPSVVVPEAVTIDPDYASREGYDPDFLAHPLPLPAPGPEHAEVASAELRYHHFSVVMHRTRALALLTGVNVDGARLRVPERTGDRWFLDPRLPVSEQTGEAVYRDNPLDRGHLVRRRDPAWGDTDAQAKAANDDTFHYTNAAPQHHLFNAGRTLWVGLEDYVLQNARHAATCRSACSPARCWRRTTTRTAASSCRASSGRSSRWSRRPASCRSPATC